MSLPDQNSWHILHIDDDEDDFVITRDMLARSSGRRIQMDWSPTFEEGREKLAQGHYTAVLVDYDLGRNTGIELIREFSSSYPAPLILFTGRGSIEVDLEAMQAGATMYLTKNEVNPLLLERAIRYAIELNQRRKAAEQVSYQASLLAQVQDAVVGADRAWQITYWNKVAETVFGWTEAEALGKTVADLLQSRFHNSSREQALQQLLSSGHYEGEVIYRHKNGFDITAITHTAIVLDPNEEPSGFVSSMLDITERKKAEEAILVSQVQLRTALDSTHDIIFSLDREWRFLYVNRNFTHAYKYSLPEVYGKIFWEIFPRYRDTDVEVNYRKAMGQKTPVHFQLGGLYTQAWYGVSIYPNENGITIFATDQTEQHLAELARQESERKFRVLFDYSPDAVFLTRPDGTIEAANPAACAMFGLSEQEICALGRSGLLDTSDSRLTDNIIARERTGFVRNWELTAIRNQGEKFPVEISSVILPGEPVRSFVVLRDITERKRAEAAIKAERDKMEAVVQNLTSGVMIADTGGRLLSMNKAALQMHDIRSVNEMIMTPEHTYQGFEMYEPGGRLVPTPDRPARRAIRGDFFNNLELRVRNVSTGREWFSLWNAVPVRDSQGEIQLIVFTMRDITDQKRYEQNLRESEARLKARNRELEAVLDTVPAYMFITHDPLSREMSGNKATLKLIRMSSGDNLSKTGTASEKLSHFKLMRDGQEIPLAELPIQQVAATGISIEDYEYDVIFADGEIRHLLGNVSPLLDEDGQPAGAVSAFIDITRRKEIEAQLRESESRFRVALASAPISVYTTDCDLRITWMYAPDPGFQMETIVGKRLEAVLPAGIAAPLIAIQQSVIDTGLAQMGEVMGWAENKPIWYAYYIDPIRDECETTTGLACAVYDITRRKQAESDLQRYAEALKRSNQALQDFAFIASHDLQEPLRKVMSFTQLLERRYETQLGPDGKDYIRRIHSATIHMADMLNGLLAYSRVTTQNAAFEKVDLREIFDEVLADLEVLIEESGGVVKLENQALIHADPMQMRQLLQNLIGNALKYHRPDVAPVVQVSTSRLDNDQVQLVVQDNGIGFDMKNAGKIFQPFVRLHTRNQFAGTGMGLAICKKIVERHGGSITVHSVPDQGTTFTVQLPSRYLEG